MRILLIFLSCTLWYVSAKPNACCPDNAPIVNETCPNKDNLWIADCPYGAYIMFSHEFKINEEDDSIKFLDASDKTIPSNRYCLGTMEPDDKIAMVCFATDADEVPEGQMSYLARIICCTISIICLALALMVYIMLPNLRDLQGKCMMFTIFSLLMAFFFLALIQYIITDDMSDLGCEALASLLYFWFMCVFFWLNVVSFNVWRSIVRPRLLSNKKHLFLLYNAYGWGAPIIFLLIVLICHNVPGNHIKPKFGETTCWFSDTTGLRTFFYGPITALIILNIIMFISTAWTLSKKNSQTIDKRRRSHLFKFSLYLKLFIIMGICWVFEPLSELFFTEGSYVWIVTDYINSLQGLIIFLLLVVFRQRVRRDLARRGGFCCRTLPQEWAAMTDEDMEELEEDIDELESSIDNNAVINRTL